MINIFALATLILTLTCLALGLLIIKYGKEQIHRIWSYFNLSLAVWGFGCFMATTAKTPENALLYWKIAHVTGLFVAPFFFHVVCIFCNINRRILLIIGYMNAIVFQIFSFSNTLDLNVQYIFSSMYYLRPQSFKYPFALIIWLFLVVYGHYELYRLYTSATNDKTKTQIKYLFIAMIIGFIGGVSNFLPMFNVYIYPYAMFTVPLYCLIATYAIFKHQLMDIEVIIRRAVVFAGLFAGVYGILAFFTFLVQDVFQAFTGGNRWLSLIPSIFIITIALRPLENFLVRITDKYLFQKKYDYRELLKTFASDVMTVLDINKLVRLTVDKLAETVKLESCGILLLNKQKEQYELAASVGIANKDISLGSGNTLVTFLDRTRLFLSIKDQGKDSRIPDKIMKDMNKLKLELAIPLIIHNEMIGILTLGAKKSGEDFTQDDMTILHTLAASLSIAINNAEMFDELGKTQAEAAQQEKMAVIGTLAAGINHEICNPLGIARGQCEVFLLNAKEGLYKNRSKEEQIYEAMRIMEKVIKETDRATAITKKLSTFAKPGSGVIEEVDIAEEVEEVMALVGHELKMDKIDFIKDIPKDLPHIMADQKQIQEIFFNLIRNAGQAIGEKGVITVRARVKDSKITIEIEDTGHGIPEDKLEQIFNPFFTTKAPGKGTGLGLFIVRQVIQRNKGRISVRSKVSVGTTFTLEFPVLEEAKR